MVVAEQLEKAVISLRAVKRRGAGPQVSTAAKATEYRMALVPTAWGLSAAAWVVPPDDAGERPTFSQKPTTALLARIWTPGLSCAQMRAAVMSRYPGSLEVIGDGHGSFHPEVVPEWFPEMVRYLQHYYTSGLRGWTEPEFVDHWTYWRPRLAWAGMTAFQRRVLEEVARIPSGEKRSYGDIARRLGKPGAGRAVGAALGQNPWPVLVPCHRVIGASGKMTGFSAPGGVTVKEQMLAMEG